MRRFSFLLPIFLSFHLGWAKAQNTTPMQNTVKAVDRTALFIKAFEILPVILAAASDMALVNNDFVGDEFRMYDGIYALLKEDFSTPPELRIKFLLQQKPFQLSPDQPVRTAITSSDPKDPIYINKKLINDPQNDIQIEDVVQLLIHEYGHKVKDKNQAAVDSIAAKIRQFLVQYSQKVATPQGDLLQLVSLPDVVGHDQVSKLIEFKNVDQEYFKTAVLFQTQEEVIDLTNDWTQFHIKSPTFQLFSRQELVRASYIKLDNLIYVDSLEKEPTFLVSFQHLENITEKTREAPKAHIVARGNWDYKDLFFKVDKTRSKIKSIFFKKQLEPENSIQAHIQEKIYLSTDRMALIVKIENLEGNNDIKLILDSDNTNISVKPKWIDKNLNLFYFEFDTHSHRSYKTNSLAINDQLVIFFTEGFSLPARISNPEKGTKINLRSIYFSDNKVRANVNSDTPLIDLQVKLHLKVTSEYDLQEIKLGVSRQNYILTPASYVTTKDDGFSMNSSARPLQEHRIESLRSSYDVITFFAADFVQKRVGKDIFIVIPLPEELSDYAFPEEERTVQRSFFDFPRKLRTNVVIGKSSKSRTINHIEFVDTKLNTSQAVPKKPWTYQVKSETYQSANPYSTMSRDSWKRYWHTFVNGRIQAADSCISIFKN